MSFCFYDGSGTDLRIGVSFCRMSAYGWRDKRCRCPKLWRFSRREEVHTDVQIHYADLRESKDTIKLRGSLSNFSCKRWVKDFLVSTRYLNDYVVHHSMPKYTLANRVVRRCIARLIIAQFVGHFKSLQQINHCLNYPGNLVSMASRNS